MRSDCVAVRDTRRDIRAVGWVVPGWVPPGFYLRWDSVELSCAIVESCERQADSTCNPTCFPYYAVYCAFAGGQYIGVENGIPWCNCYIPNGCSPAVIDYCHSMGRDIYTTTCLCTQECWWELHMDCAFSGGLMNIDCDCVAPGQGGGCDLDSPCGDNKGYCYKDSNGWDMYCYNPNCISLNQISYFERFCGGFFEPYLQRWCVYDPMCQ